MSIHTWFNSLKPQRACASVQRARRDPARGEPRPNRLAFEALEVRSMMAAAPMASFAVGDATIVEGDGGIQYAAVNVSLSAATAKTVQVSYNTVDGTAKAGSDYTAASGKLTFAPGEISKSILLAVRGEELVESKENFFVNLSGARQAKIADGQAVVTIVDDDDNRPRVSIDDVWARDGDAGTTLYTFTVTLSSPLGEAVTVNYATADRTATAADGDYLATSGTLTFAPLETTRTITVEVIGNATNPIATVNSGFVETFYVNLTGASGNAQLIDGQGVGTIHYYDRVTLPADPYPYLSESPNGPLYLGADGLIYYADGTLYGDGTLG